MFDQATRGADQDIDPAQHRGLHLEILATGDQTGLEEGELGEALDFLEGLLGQLTGGQHDHRAHAHARRGSTIAQQAIEHRQDEGRRLAAAGLCRDPQILPLQRQRNSRQLHRGGLGKVQRSHGFEQTFMQGELGKHGATSTKKQKSAA
ncbi:hypothetical protein FQZ97_969360 [compost metagenome]